LFPLANCDEDFFTCPWAIIIVVAAAGAQAEKMSSKEFAGLVSSRDLLRKLSWKPNLVNSSIINMSSSSEQSNLPEIKLKKPSSGVNPLNPSHSMFQKAKVANIADKGTPGRPPIVVDI
jgi:hypothetical protein